MPCLTKNISDRRMSYKECYRILTDPQPEDAEEYGSIIPMLKNMKELSEILESMRKKRGAIGFEMPETKVILNDDGTVQTVAPARKMALKSAAPKSSAAEKPLPERMAKRYPRLLERSAQLRYAPSDGNSHTFTRPRKAVQK